MATKKFPSELNSRGTVKVADILLISNIDTNATEKVTVAALMTSRGLIGQIPFPATQIPSANVNTLDDYEEGTFTPVLTFGGASVGITYGTQVGKYTKIGNLVNVDIYIVLTSKGSSTGAAVIGGLPFTSSYYSAISFGTISKVSFADFPTGYISAATITIILKETTNAGVNTSLDNANFVDDSGLILSCNYRV